MSKDKTSGPSGPDNTADDKSAKDTHYATLRRAHRDAKRERGEIPTPVPQKRKRQRSAGMRRRMEHFHRPYYAAN